MWELAYMTINIEIFANVSWYTEAIKNHWRKIVFFGYLA